MARKGRKCLRTAGCAVCVLVLGVLLGVSRSPELLMSLLVKHVTFWHANITAKMWLKDMRYIGSEPSSAIAESPFPPQHGDTQWMLICRLSIYLKFAEELHSAVQLTPITDRRVTLPPKERAEAYLQACLEVIPGLPAEQKEILGSLKPVPLPWQFHLNVTHAWMNGRWTRPLFGGIENVMQQIPGPESPLGTEAQWHKDREVQAAALPSLEKRWKPREELERLPPSILRGFDDMGVYPVEDEHIDVKEIPDALVQGRTALFDATKLCGKEVFNLTLPDIARLHGPTAADIPVFKLNSAGYGDGTFDTLEEAGQRFKRWSDMGWQHYPEFGPFIDQLEVEARDRAITPTDPVVSMLESLFASAVKAPTEVARGILADQLRSYRRSNSQVTINVKRLPKLPLQDMHENMGSPNWTARLWNLLWIGPVGDFWHFDEEDNLLIGISGNIYVAVMEQPYTDLVSGTRNIGLGWNNLMGFFQYRVPGHPYWVDENPWIKKIPIHFVKLEPGMGITVPSRTYHNVLALDGNRILMNCFMFPKWRAREAGEHHWFRAGTQADSFRAMWHLKVASVARLWDTRRVGGFFAGYKLEVL